MKIVDEPDRFLRIVSIRGKQLPLLPYERWMYDVKRSALVYVYQTCLSDSPLLFAKYLHPIVKQNTIEDDEGEKGEKKTARIQFGDVRIQLNLHDLAIMYCEGEIEIMEDEDSEVS